MKLSNILKVAVVVSLALCATSCQTKKQKAAAAAEQARLEAEAAAKAAAEAEARLFILNDAVTPVSCGEINDETLATTVADFNAKFQAYCDANVRVSTTVALPAAGIKFSGAERCDVLGENRELIAIFAETFNKTNKQAKIVVKGYALDTKDCEYNDQIAIERCNRVESLLVANGIEKKQIEKVAVCGCKAKKAGLKKADSFKVEVFVK